MHLSIIVAAAENGAIGKNNELLWHLPQDLKRFKEITTDHTIIMGRKTFESIGKPLPNRRSVVITQNKSFKVEGVSVVHSIEEALQLVQGEDEVFIIGGGTIYTATLPFVDRLYFTRVHENFEGDTFFPELDKSEWLLVEREELPVDAKNAHAATFEKWERKKAVKESMSPAQMQAFCQNTLVTNLGIEFVEISGEKLVAKMPVDERTCQPFGFLHGGASLALLETVGSGLSAAFTDISSNYIFGMSVTANHLKPATKGFVYATASFLHKGQKTQVVDVRIVNDAGDLVCDGRITNMIVPK